MPHEGVRKDEQCSTLTRMSWTRRFVLALSVVLAALAGALLAAPGAQAHEERPVTFPDGSGTVPKPRTGEPDLLVCKTDRADFERRISGFPAGLKARNLALFERCVRGERHEHDREHGDEPSGPRHARESRAMFTFLNPLRTHQSARGPSAPR